jgi:hypothetical protein
VSNVASGKVVVDMESGRTTTLIVKWAEAMRGGLPESATCTVKAEVPPTVGVPEIEPSPPKLSPAGSEPELGLHVNGATPPDSSNIALYVRPPVASGKDVVEIDGGATTVTVREADLLVSIVEVAVILTVSVAVTGFGAVKFADVGVWLKT